MKKIITLLVLALTTNIIIAQDIDEFSWFGDDYEDQLFFSLGFNNITITNNEAPNSAAHKLVGNTIKFDVKKTNFELGGPSWYYESKLLGDILYFGAQAFKDPDKIYQEENTTLSSGLLGWVTGLWNITEPKQYQIAVGMSFKDFNLFSAYPEDESKAYANPSNNTMLEPAGNYYTIGPSLGAKYNVANIVLVEFRADLSIPFGKVDPSVNSYIEDKDFKNPYFMNYVLEVNSSKGLFVGFETLGLLERTKAKNNAKRKELFVGFRIPI